MTPTVVIFDQLVDFTHPALKDVIDMVVTIDNNGNVEPYDKSYLEISNPYEDDNLNPYLNHSTFYGHAR